MTEVDQQIHPVVNNKNDSVIGFKYFEFAQSKPNQKTEFSVDLRDGTSSGQMEVWLGDPGNSGEKIGTVSIEKQANAAETWHRISIPVSNIAGRHAVYLKFAGGNEGATIADIRSFEFSSRISK